MTRVPKKRCEWPGCASKSTHQVDYVTGKVGVCARHARAYAWWRRRMISGDNVVAANRMAADIAAGNPGPFTVLCQTLGAELNAAQQQVVANLSRSVPNVDEMADALEVPETVFPRRR